MASSDEGPPALSCPPVAERRAGQPGQARTDLTRLSRARRARLRRPSLDQPPKSAASTPRLHRQLESRAQGRRHSRRSSYAPRTHRGVAPSRRPNATPNAPEGVRSRPRAVPRNHSYMVARPGLPLTRESSSIEWMFSLTAIPALDEGLESTTIRGGIPSAKNGMMTALCRGIWFTVVDDTTLRRLDPSPCFVLGRELSNSGEGDGTARVVRVGNCKRRSAGGSARPSISRSLAGRRPQSCLSARRTPRSPGLVRVGWTGRTAKKGPWRLLLRPELGRKSSIRHGSPPTRFFLPIRLCGRRRSTFWPSGAMNRGSW